MNQLQKKLGPLKLWQWLAIGGGTGLALYWYKRTHESAAPQVNPEEEERLLGALRAGGGGGGESSGGGGSVAAPEIGAPGLTGVAGEPGIAGPQGEGFNPAPLESRLGGIEQQLATNNPPALSHTTAPKVNPQHLTRNPANGETYRTIKRGGRTVHEYPHRTGANKFVAVGGKGHGKPTGHAQKRKPAKRPKPTPIHHRVTVHRAPAHRAAPKPVHHPAPKRKRR